MSESTPRAENSRDFFERPRRVNAGKHSKRLIQETLDGTRRLRRKQASKKKSTKDGVEEKNDIYEVEKILMLL